MATAVTLHETTKHFSIPGIPLWSRAALRNAKPNSPAQPQALVAIDHVSFSIRQGEIFGLVGPSGSGKTTLIRLIATLLQPDSGDIRVFGYDMIRQPAKVQRLINRVSVEASFFKQLSPLENLLNGMQPYGLGETETLWQALEILTRLGLEPERNPCGDGRPAEGQGCKKWSLPGLCSPGRACCCWMSPPEAWTCAPNTKSGRSCESCMTSMASRSCWLPKTVRRWKACATG